MTQLSLYNRREQTTKDWLGWSITCDSSPPQVDMLNIASSSANSSEWPGWIGGLLFVVVESNHPFLFWFILHLSNCIYMVWCVVTYWLLFGFAWTMPGLPEALAAENNLAVCKFYTKESWSSGRAGDGWCALFFASLMLAGCLLVELPAAAWFGGGMLAWLDNAAWLGYSLSFGRGWASGWVRGWVLGCLHGCFVAAWFFGCMLESFRSHHRGIARVATSQREGGNVGVYLIQLICTFQ